MYKKNITWKIDYKLKFSKVVVEGMHLNFLPTDCRSLRSASHGDVIKWKHFPRYWPFCAWNSAVTGEFPSQRTVTLSFDVFSDPRLNKQLSKESIRRWFETPSRSFWRHCNVIMPRHFQCGYCFCEVVHCIGDPLDPYPCRHMASEGHNELTGFTWLGHICI